MVKRRVNKSRDYLGLVSAVVETEQIEEIDCI